MFKVKDKRIRKSITFYLKIKMLF